MKKESTCPVCIRIFIQILLKREERKRTEGEKNILPHKKNNPYRNLGEISKMTITCNMLPISGRQCPKSSSTVDLTVEASGSKVLGRP